MAAAAAFDLQAHRGGRGLAPESTLAAFRNAIALGVTTLETDLAPHQFRQLLAYRQAKTCPAEFTRCRFIRLDERRKQRSGPVLSNANARVRNSASKRNRVRILAGEHHPYGNLAAAGELDGIRGQIGDNLAQPGRIAAKLRRGNPQV